MDLDEEQGEIRELRNLEYREAIGIENITSKKYGKERGLNPKVSEDQVKDVTKLASRLSFKNGDQKVINDDEVEEAFDILSKPRVILYKGYVNKKSKTSMMPHQSKRLLYLLNDVLLVTSQPASSLSKSAVKLGLSTDKYVVHNILYLKDLSIKNLSYMNMDENVGIFEVISPDRTFEFTAESEVDKRIWLEELEAAIISINLPDQNKLPIGWIHDIVLSTPFSAAYRGDTNMLTKLISNDASIIDNCDEYGMNCLHWASFKDHKNIVVYLLTEGAKPDALNNGLNSPLMLAASQGHEDVVTILLEAEADIHTRNLKDRDALFMAVLYAQQSIGLSGILRKLVIAGVDVNSTDATGSSPLHECAARNLPRSVMLLVDSGANVNMVHIRNGLTPLQMACNATYPDVETVRTLLDKGAYPNWKDAAMRSSFDMVLLTHSQIMKTKIVKDLSTQDPASMKKTVDEVAYFVNYALPVLMELVRKGARYTDVAVSGLRHSFQEALATARTYFNDVKEDDNFFDYALAKGPSVLQASRWIKDKEFNYCLLCLQSFTMRIRKHHCRACGVLCCDNCSTKRLGLNITDDPDLSPAASPTPPREVESSSRKKSLDKKVERVCDGCFNRLNFESFLRNHDLLRRRKEQEKKDEMNRKGVEDAVITDSERSPKSKLFGWNKTTEESASVKPQSTQKMGAVQAVLSEASDALAQRGEKLQETLDKVDELSAAASAYNQNAKELLRQQQQKSIW